MKNSTLLLLFMMMMSNAYGNYYSPAQQDKLILAYEAGAAINGLPETMQGIILQESSACELKFNASGDDTVSLGCGHVTENAAIDVFRYCERIRHVNGECASLGSPIYDSASLRLRLVLDDRFNITVAAIYLKMQYTYFKSKGYSLPWTRAVVSYNCGRTCVKRMSTERVAKHIYVSYIHERIKNVKKYQVNQLARLNVMDKNASVATIIDGMINNHDIVIPNHIKADVISELQHYVMIERAKALGWAHANAVISHNAGVDIGKLSVNALLDKGLKELTS